jgi:hypothetical protein
MADFEETVAVFGVHKAGRLDWTPITIRQF